VISFPFICVIFKLVSPVERIKRCYQDMKLTENVQFGERLAGRIQLNGGRKEILAKVGEDVLVLKPCVRCVQPQNFTLQFKSHTISKGASSSCRVSVNHVDTCWVGLALKGKMPRKRARITQGSGPYSGLEFEKSLFFRSVVSGPRLSR